MGKTNPLKLHLQDINHTPPVTELNCLQKEHCKCKVEPLPSCTQPPSGGSCSKPGKHTAGGTLHCQTPVKGVRKQGLICSFLEGSRPGHYTQPLPPMPSLLQPRAHHFHSEGIDFHPLYYSYRSGLHLLKSDFSW